MPDIGDFDKGPGARDLELLGDVPGCSQIGMCRGGRRDIVAKTQRDGAMHELAARGMSKQAVAASRRDPLFAQRRKNALRHAVGPLLARFLAPLGVFAVAQRVPLRSWIRRSGK